MAGVELEIQSVSTDMFLTEPPEHLTEGRLLATMEAQGIGTDASMSGHIQKILERTYATAEVHHGNHGPRGLAVAVELPDSWFRTRREIHPTKLGSALFRWYMLQDEELALPTIRADVEAACMEVSRGERDGTQVLIEFIEYFKNKFWNMFCAPQSASVRAALVNVLRKSDDQLSRDPTWVRGQRKVLDIRLEHLAKKRSARSASRRAHSAPAEATINHCFMVDASIMSSSGHSVPARSLSIGDRLPAIYEHLGRLARGQCSVIRIRSLLPRDRDVATVFAQGVNPTSVKVTSNHSLMAKRDRHDLAWGPVVARDLSIGHVVAYNDFAHANYNDNPHPRTADVIRSHVQCEKVSVVELELDSGEVAAWLRASPVGLIASFGEFPKQHNTVGKQVAVWGFSRCPPTFRQALRESAELARCRNDLVNAGHPFILPQGGHMFVRPEEAELVLKALELKKLAPRPSEVVVSPEFENRLVEALGLVPGRENFHRRQSEQVPLDSAMRCFGFYRNARPFQYVVGNIVVQGRRTFIEIGEDRLWAQAAATV